MQKALVLRTLQTRDSLERAKGCATGGDSGGRQREPIGSDKKCYRRPNMLERAIVGILSQFAGCMARKPTSLAVREIHYSLQNTPIGSDRAIWGAHKRLLGNRLGSFCCAGCRRERRNPHIGRKKRKRGRGCRGKHAPVENSSVKVCPSVPCSASRIIRLVTGRLQTGVTLRALPGRPPGGQSEHGTASS